MKRIELTPNTTINWKREYGVNALYLDDMTFNPINDIDEELIMFIDEEFYDTHVTINLNEEEISKEYKNSYYNYPNGIVFALYANNDLLVGFVRKKATWE